MSIGSFLATAGDIGAGIEEAQTQSELLRRARQASVAQRAAMERAEVERRRLQEARASGLAVPDISGLTAAPTGQVAGLLPAITPTAPAPTPTPSGEETPTPDMQVVTQRLFETGAGILTPKTGAAAPAAARRTVRFGGVDVPVSLDTKAPDKLRTGGVAGFRRIDPNASDAAKANLYGLNVAQLEGRLGQMANATDLAFSSIRAYLAPQDRKAEILASEKASAWYDSDKAKQYFSRNPEMLPIAERDPLGFHRAILQGGKKAAPAPAPTDTGAPTGEMVGRFPKSYKDPRYDKIEEIAAARVGVPVELLRAVRLAGERSNADQKSSAGARTPYQFTPGTRRLFISKYDVDPWSTPLNAATATALHLKESLDKGLSPVDALREYHGGPNRSRWGKENAAYAQRVAAFLGQDVDDGAAAPRRAGVDAGTTPAQQEPVLNLTNLNSYLGKPDRVPTAVANTSRQRDLIRQEAMIYANSGNEAAYQQSLAKIQALDANLTRLVGAQAIIDTNNFNDPRRAESLLSYLSNGQLQVRMREDGRFAFFAQNQQGEFVPVPGQDNVSRAQFLRTLREASDETYRTQMEAAETAMAQSAMEFAQKRNLALLEGQIKGEIAQFEGGVDIQQTLIQAQAALRAAQLRGQDVTSLQVGEENWITYADPTTGEQMLSRPTEVTLPSGQIITTMDAKTLTDWAGGQ